MTIEQLIIKMKSDVLTSEEQDELLLKAKIINKDGNYFSKYFSNETIERDNVKRK